MNATMAPQRYMITVAGQLAGATCDFACLVFVFLPYASCPYRGLSSPRVGEFAGCPVKAKFHYTSWLGASSELAPNMFGASSELASVMEFGFYHAYMDLCIPDMMVTIYRFITRTFYKCRRCTNFVRVSQTQFRKQQQ